MTSLLSLPLLFVLALADSTAYQFGGQGLKPDLVVMTVVAWSVLRGVREALVWGAVGAVALGLFSTYPLAPLLPLLVVAVLAAVGAGAWRRRKVVAALLFAGLATAVYDLGMVGLLQITEVPVDWVQEIHQRIGPTVFINTVFMVVAYPLLLWLHNRTKPREMWP